MNAYIVGILVAVLISFVLRNRRKGKVYGVPVDVGGDAGFAIRRHSTSFLVEKPWEGASTLADLFEQACKRHAQMRLLGTRKLISRETKVSEDGRSFEKLHLGGYEWLSYGQSFERVCNFASGLVELGHERGERVAIFAETRAEWLIALQGCFRQNNTVVTIYASLGEEALVHSLNEATSARMGCMNGKLGN